MIVEEVNVAEKIVHQSFQPRFLAFQKTVVHKQTSAEIVQAQVNAVWKIVRQRSQSPLRDFQMVLRKLSSAGIVEEMNVVARTVRSMSRPPLPYFQPTVHKLASVEIVE